MITAKFYFVVFGRREEIQIMQCIKRLQILIMHLLFAKMMDIVN